MENRWKATELVIQERGRMLSRKGKNKDDDLKSKRKRVQYEKPQRKNTRKGNSDNKESRGQM